MYWALLWHLGVRALAGAFVGLMVLDAIETEHFFGLYMDCNGLNYATCSGVEQFWWYALWGAVIGILVLSWAHKG